MDFLIDLETIKEFVQQNEKYLLNNYVKIAESDVEGVILCITSDAVSGLEVAIFNNSELCESWGNIEDFHDFLDCIEDASDMIMEMESGRKVFSANDTAYRIEELLKDLGVDEDFWDEITNDFCSTLNFYGYEIK